MLDDLRILCRASFTLKYSRWRGQYDDIVARARIIWKWVQLCGTVDNGTRGHRSTRVDLARLERDIVAIADQPNHHLLLLADQIHDLHLLIPRMVLANFIKIITSYRHRLVVDEYYHYQAHGLHCWLQLGPYLSPSWCCCWTLSHCLHDYRVHNCKRPVSNFSNSNGKTNK